MGPLDRPHCLTHCSDISDDSAVPMAPRVVQGIKNTHEICSPKVIIMGPLVNICLMSCAEIFGNANFQKYSSSNAMHHCILGILGYIGVIYFLIKSFGHGNMMWVSTLWQSSVILLSASFAYFYLGERFHHPVQYIGILLGALAVFCVQYK